MGDVMFGFGKAKKADVLSHWYTLVDQFNIPCQDFYKSVQDELNNRKVPDLTISNVTFPEGGVMSADRIYLRMKRERLVFDVCAAPFGTSYFFSMRFAELPSGLLWWQWFLILLIMFTVVGFVVWVAGFQIGGAMAFILMILIVFMFIDSKAESYYRQDTRLMYLEIVNAVVKQKVAECTSAAGINLLNIRQHSPIYDALYQSTQVEIEREESPPNTPPATTWADSIQS